MKHSVKFIAVFFVGLVFLLAACQGQNNES
jgi:hypothetical protein